MALSCKTGEPGELRKSGESSKSSKNIGSSNSGAEYTGVPGAEPILARINSES